MYNNSYDDLTLEAVEMEFLGLGKKARARREEKRDKKNDRKIAKINARSEGREKVAKSGGGFLKRVGGGILDVAKTVMGQGNATLETATVDSGGVRAEFTPKEEEKKPNYVLWGIVILVIIVIAIVVIRMLKKK